MHYDMKECGERIRQLRTQKGLTQEAIAQALNVDRSFYGRIESGKKGCSVDILVRLASLFETSLDYLVLGTEESLLYKLSFSKALKANITNLIDYLQVFAAKL